MILYIRVTNVNLESTDFNLSKKKKGFLYKRQATCHLNINGTMD